MRRKAEASDVEALDKNKADISALKECMEKLNRLEMMVQEGFYVEGEEDEEEGGTMYDDEEIDPEELKDQVNNNSGKGLHSNENSAGSINNQANQLTYTSPGGQQHPIIINPSKFNRSAMDNHNNATNGKNTRNYKVMGKAGSDFSRDDN